MFKMLVATVAALMTLSFVGTASAQRQDPTPSGQQRQGPAPSGQQRQDPAPSGQQAVIQRGRAPISSRSNRATFGMANLNGPGLRPAHLLPHGNEHS
jgi:hypothetical protein